MYIELDIFLILTYTHFLNYKQNKKYISFTTIKKVLIQEPDTIVLSTALLSTRYSVRIIFLIFKGITGESIHSKNYSEWTSVYTND